VKLRERIRIIMSVLGKTLERFSGHRGDLLAAALAFHALLSIAPLIIVAVGVAGMVLGRRTAQLEVTRWLQGSLGDAGASTVGAWVRQAPDSPWVRRVSENGVVASVIGLGLTLVAASSLGAQLRSALNHIWNIDVFQAPNFKLSVKDYLQRRLFAVALTFAAGPLLLVVFASRAVLFAFSEVLFGGSAWRAAEFQLLQIAFSLLVVALICGGVFRYVPNRRVPWRCAFVGGAVTSFAFNIGNGLVGLYLSRASVVAAYGAAASLVVVLLWFYFSAQMLLFGAEFTRIYAERASMRPSALPPAESSSPVTSE
jgi:membrane protein